MESTFKDAMFFGTNIDRSFGFNRLRCRPGFVVPRHHHNIGEMVIVYEGEYWIEHPVPGEPEKTQVRRVGPGEFFTSEPDTPYTMKAGPEGVIYTEQWNAPRETLRTYWYDHGWQR
jgi:quercetin dioxygenase-like cupin family protein